MPPSFEARRRPHRSRRANPEHAPTAHEVRRARIATLGGQPSGLAGHVVGARSWDDYSLQRDTVVRNLGALDEVYSGVIADHRGALREIEELDPVSHR